MNKNLKNMLVDFSNNLKTVFDDVNDDIEKATHSNDSNIPTMAEVSHLKSNIGLYKGIVAYLSITYQNLINSEYGWDDWNDQPLTSDSEDEEIDKQCNNINDLLESPILTNLLIHKYSDKAKLNALIAVKHTV